MAQDEDPEAATQPGSLRPSRSIPSVHYLQRQSTNDRINEILEIGRERAQRIGSLASTQGSTKESTSGQPSSSDTATQEQSAEEATGIYRKNRSSSYRSAHTAESGTRSRRTIYSRRSLENVAAQGGGPDVEPEQDAQVNGDASASAAASSPPWWRTFLAKFQSIELENKASVARDHLALERTFLSWVRTSLAFASIGIAVTQLFRLNLSLPGEGGDSNSHLLRQMGKPLGTTFLAISILILLLGYKRFLDAQQWIMRGKFPASRTTILVVTTLSFAIMVASLVVLVVIHPSDKSN